MLVGDSFKDFFEFSPQYLGEMIPNWTTCAYFSKGLVQPPAKENFVGMNQWICLVPLKGGRFYIITQLAVYTTYIYIPRIYCLLGDYMLPTTCYGNQKQPLNEFRLFRSFVFVGVPSGFLPKLPEQRFFIFHIVLAKR